MSHSLLCDYTCVGDGMLLPASVSVGDGKGPRPRGDSWSTGCSGDRLSLLSSSNDELPPEAFGKVSEREGEKKEWISQQIKHEHEFTYCSN